MGASMNPYLENLEKIEFVVTYACTGRCRHCSEGDHTAHGGAIACGIPLLLSPAWLVGETADNHYNRKTRALLACFADRGIPVGAGNVILPSGNARRYLAEYFVGDIPENPYAEDPHNVRCVSFSPNGDVLGDNVYRRDIMEILSRYLP